MTEKTQYYILYHLQSRKTVPQLQRVTGYDLKNLFVWCRSLKEAYLLTHDGMHWQLTSEGLIRMKELENKHGYNSLHSK